MAKSAFRGSPRMSAPKGGGDMMRQAQKLQEEVARAQAEVELREFEASAGGGVVTAKVSGKKDLLSLVISPEAIDPDDAEMLQDMIIAAVNEAMHKVDAAMGDAMGKFNLGGLGGLF